MVGFEEKSSLKKIKPSLRLKSGKKEEKMKSYRVFTVSSGSVTEGAEISTLHLKGAGVDIPAIIIGEEGRGRSTGVLPVVNPPMIPCPDRGKEKWSSSDTCEKCGMPLSEKKENGYRQHGNDGLVRGRLMFAEVGQTKVNKPKLIARSSANSDEKVIVVFRTSGGYRGSASHTGDRVGWKCQNYSCDAEGNEIIAPEKCPKCGSDDYSEKPSPVFGKFAGEIIASGHIAQGDAGRMGGNEQIIALMPKDVVFRTSYSGRLYGGASSHYYKWDGEKLTAMTWQEREVLMAIEEVGQEGGEYL